MPISHFTATSTRWLRCERGSLMTEYGLLVLMVAVAMVVTLGLLGAEVLDLFSGADAFEGRPPVPLPD